MEKSRLPTRSAGYRRAVGDDGSAWYKRERREAEHEQD